jgi:hypothetical protein
LKSPTRRPNGQACRPSFNPSRSLAAPTPPSPPCKRRPSVGNRNRNAQPKAGLRHGAPPCPPSATARRKAGCMRRMLTPVSRQHHWNRQIPKLHPRCRKSALRSDWN